MEYDLDHSSPTTKFEGYEPLSTDTGYLTGESGLFGVPPGETELESLFKSISQDNADLYNIFEQEDDLSLGMKEAPPLLPALEPITEIEGETGISLLPIKSEPGVSSQNHEITGEPLARAPKKQKTEVGAQPTPSPEDQDNKGLLVNIKKSDKQREANKMSAQASRQRKKDLKDQLEKQVQDLTLSNKQIDEEIIELRTENRVLRNECLQLQETISHSMTISKPVIDKAKLKVHKAITSGSEGDDLEILSGEVEASSPLQSSTQQQQAAALMYMMLMLQSINGVSTQTVMNNLLPMMSALSLRKDVRRERIK